ncbi:oligosaccharide flippase family protein [Pseudidiomarina sp. 1APR75-33.1]|uniref:lipopolysaccharide biosynthesis protein n=1 Tax=Pseudidiomarina terrestris TaxID=2820060 RepID=UPI002655C1A6|nr:oligosaccharide flippase family protein [Pseudidiomarina sp. 1APR75-33.1]MDN7126944.1 oligosaccharide flippase family protein [Pseudidiomarina sp. 1APR75-33.1]
MSTTKNQIFTLMTGTSLAQLLPILAMPLLSRIYSPEDFGRYAFYLSISAIISAVSCARYEHAIFLPKEKRHAINVVYCCLFILTIISLSSFLIVVLLQLTVPQIFNKFSLDKVVYFIPITVFLTGLNQVLINWLNRNNEYRKISKVRVLQSVSVIGSSIAGGYLSAGPQGLIAGNIVGLIFSCFLMARFSLSKDEEILLGSYSKNRVIVTAKRYKNFPKFDLLATFFNISSHQLPHTLLNIFFGPKVAGGYYMAQKVFGLPINLISGSIQEVLRQKLSYTFAIKGDSRSLFLTTLKWLAIGAAVPTLLIYLFAIDIFVLVFGSEWQSAGVFVQVLLPAFYFRFICFPLSYMFYIAEKQRVNLFGQGVFFSTIILSFIIGKNFDVIYTLYLVMTFNALFYLSYLFLSYKFTSKN